jgi:hypothetical protein
MVINARNASISWTQNSSFGLIADRKAGEKFIICLSTGCTNFINIDIRFGDRGGRVHSPPHTVTGAGTEAYVRLQFSVSTDLGNILLNSILQKFISSMIISLDTCSLMQHYRFLSWCSASCHTHCLVKRSET